MDSQTSTTAHWNKKAFTLTEVIISMTIGTALMAMILSVVITQGNLCNTVGNYEIANRQNRIALKQFESDVRHTRTILATESNPNGYDPKTIKMEIVTGINPNGELTKENITYTYDTIKKQLHRQQGSNQKRTLIDNLSSCQFSYFGINDNPLPSAKNSTPSPTELRKVVLSGIISQGPKNRENKDHILTASVVLRKPIN